MKSFRIPALSQWKRLGTGYQWQEPKDQGERLYTIMPYGKLWVATVIHEDGSSVIGARLLSTPEKTLYDLRRNFEQPYN